jgi:hypothetical protein
MHLLSRGHNLDDRDRPRKCRFDRMDDVRITWINGSTCPADQPPQPSFQGNSRHPWAKVVHHTTRSRAVRTSQPSYRAKPTQGTDSGAMIRSVQGERRWITGSSTPLNPTAHVVFGPRAQPTSLFYKRHLTLTGIHTQRWSISFPLFCSLRVGLL